MITFVSTLTPFLHQAQQLKVRWFGFRAIILTPLIAAQCPGALTLLARQSVTTTGVQRSSVIVAYSAPRILYRQCYAVAALCWLRSLTPHCCVLCLLYPYTYQRAVDQRVS